MSKLNLAKQAAKQRKQVTALLKKIRQIEIAAKKLAEKSIDQSAFRAFLVASGTVWLCERVRSAGARQ